MRYAYRVPFIDREAELGILERVFSSGSFSLVLVYGRRRVGKTRLLKEFLRRYGGVYYVASELTYPQLCREFVRVVSSSLNYVPKSEDFVGVLEEISERFGRVVVVIDEFQYVVESDPSLPSRLQRSIDGVLSRSKLMLILCGSAVSFFEKELLGYRAPLYGRRSATIRLRPLRFLNAYGFLRNLSLVDAVRTYAILGGTPAYLTYAYGASNLEDVVKEVIAPGSPLLDEAEGLLKQELREPRRYMALLKALAEGRVSPYEAATSAGIDPRSIHKYLEVLQELDIIEVRKPLGFRRGARVFFRDNYFRFWFKYVLPHRHLIELGGVNEVINYVLRSIDSYTSITFQQIIEDSLLELHRVGVIPSTPLQYGPWWHKGEEIDLIVKDPGKSTTFVEVKWSELTVNEALNIIKKLRVRSGRTGLQEGVNYYVVIAKRIKDSKEPIMRLGNEVITDFIGVTKELIKERN